MHPVTQYLHFQAKERSRLWRFSLKLEILPWSVGSGEIHQSIFFNERQNQPQCFAASSSSIKFRIMSMKAGFLPLHYFQIMHVVHSTGCFIGIPLMVYFIIPRELASFPSPFLTQPTGNFHHFASSGISGTDEGTVSLLRIVDSFGTSLRKTQASLKDGVPAMHVIHVPAPSSRGALHGSVLRVSIHQCLRV